MRRRKNINFTTATYLMRFVAVQLRGSAALAGKNDTTNVTFSTLGLRSSTSFGMSGAEATIRGLVGCNIAGAPIAKNAAVLDLAMSGNTTFGVPYQGQLAGRAQQHGFDASLSLKF